MFAAVIWAGEDPVDEDLRLLIGMDAESARRLLDGEASPRLPNPLGWLVDQQLDMCFFADGSVIRVGQNIVCYGEREDRDRGHAPISPIQ